MAWFEKATKQSIKIYPHPLAENNTRRTTKIKFMYYIYHIPGIKIGCTTKHPEKRVKEQGYIDYEVLEEHTDLYIASNREIELQKQYNYPVDNTPFYKTYELTLSGKTSKGGKVSGRMHVESGLWERITKSSVGSKKAGKISGEKHKQSGHIQALGKKYGTIYGKMNAESGKLAEMREIQLSKIRTCPYCSKIIKGCNYFRWHGEKCKLKTNI